MMKQAEDAVTPTTGAKRKMDIQITNQDRLNTLLKSGNDAVFLLPKKKELLLKIYTNSSKIISKASNADSKLHSNLSDSLKLLIPSSKSEVTKAKNEDLANKLVDLNGAMQILYDVLEEEKASNIAAIAHLRSSTRSSGRDEDIAHSIVKEFVDMMHLVEKTVKADQSIHSSSSSKLLTRSQREKPFNHNRVPLDEALKKCLECGHDSINIPIECDSIVEENKKVNDEYEAKVKIWNNYLEEKKKKKKNIKPPCDESGKEMRRAPTRGKLKSQILMCMCSTSKCLMRNSDNGSTCPINCCDVENGNKRYPYVGSPPNCMCPICVCQCTEAYTVADIHKISIQKSQQAYDDHVQKMGKTEYSSAASTAANVTNFFGHMFESGMERVGSFVQQQKNQMRGGYNDKKKQEQQVSHTSNLLYESTAKNIALKGAQSLSLLDRKRLGDFCGNSTRCSLPNGQMFETKTIGMSNKHAYNNQLGSRGELVGLVTPAKPQPGMVDNLNIDFSLPHSDKFKATYSSSSLASPAAAVGTSNTIINLFSQSDDEEGDHKISAVTGHQTISHSTITSSATRISNPMSPTKNAWKRLLCRNAKDIKMDKDINQLDEEEKITRKKAKKVAKHLMENADKCKPIISTIGYDLDLEAGNFCTQELKRKYVNTFMSDDEE